MAEGADASGYVEPHLDVTPSVARVGEKVSLRGVGLDRYLSGVMSRLQVQQPDGTWTTEFMLFVGRGGADPTYRRPEDVNAIVALGITGDVQVVVPPIPPGLYRIERKFVVPRSEPPPHQVFAYGSLEVVG
jgi:hypothetical protein